MKTNQKNNRRLRIGLVVPHIFMQRDVLPHVIFSPGDLALSLANGLEGLGVDITLFTPGPVNTKARNITADQTYFNQELAGRGDTPVDLLKKHPFTFITLARQLQSELIAAAYAMANNDELDIVHIYTNEEEIALPFATLCLKPVVFTHHDPFNFLVRYKSVFPKYAYLNWISLSYAQRAVMPADTNWVGNVYHGLSDNSLRPVSWPANNYVAYLGRIIEPKGVHLAIDAVKQYNQKHPEDLLELRIAGKHYAGHKKDTYWQTRIKPLIDGKIVRYEGFINTPTKKRAFLGNARAVMVPSLFAEPFGMVATEALACGTPVIGLTSGALPEVITDNITGFVVPKLYHSGNTLDENLTANALAAAVDNILTIDRSACRRDYESRFTAERMCKEHLTIYEQLTR